MTRPRAFVSCQLVGSAIERLKQAFAVEYRNSPYPASAQEFLVGAQSADGVVSFLDDKINASVMDQCPQLKAIANVAVGFNNIDIDEATKRGILVVNTPGVLTNATADLTLALLLAAARRVAESDRYVRAGRWKGWSADLMLGQELSGKTLGIIGMGRIGEAVAKRAVAFGMKIAYLGRGEREKDERLRKDFGAVKVAFEELLSTSDFISMHCPMNAETQNLIGKSEFARMKPNCIFINTARGGVVDQLSLVEALRGRKIAGAALDVFEDEPNVPAELLTMENVVLAPHIGSATVETRSAMCDLAVDGLIASFNKTLPPNAVNRAAWDHAILARKR